MVEGKIDWHYRCPICGETTGDKAFAWFSSDKYCEEHKKEEENNES